MTDAYYDPDAAFDEMAFADLRKSHYADQARIAVLEARLAVIHEITLDTTAESSAEDIERIRLLASQQETT